jgi:hypothetical protein
MNTTREWYITDGFIVAWSVLVALLLASILFGLLDQFFRRDLLLYLVMFICLISAGFCANVASSWGRRLSVYIEANHKIYIDLQRDFLRNIETVYRMNKRWNDVEVERLADMVKRHSDAMIFPIGTFILCVFINISL